MPMPEPWELFTIETYHSSWPMSAEKCELIEGVVYWSGGPFTEEDRERAQRAFPDRVIEIGDGYLALLPSDHQVTRKN